jgi:DNA-binding NarL/FixJ family response regulator
LGFSLSRCIAARRSDSILCLRHDRRYGHFFVFFKEIDMNLRALTEKQLMIAQRLSDGLTVEEIAAERHRSVQTIRKHVEQARDRLGARNLAHLVALTLRQGMIH